MGQCGEGNYPAWNLHVVRYAARMKQVCTKNCKMDIQKYFIM